MHFKLINTYLIEVFLNSCYLPLEFLHISTAWFVLLWSCSCSKVLQQLGLYKNWTPVAKETAFLIT